MTPRPGLGSWFVVGHPPGVSVAEPVAVAFEVDDFGVVDETVDHGGGDGVVTEGLAPAIWKGLLEVTMTEARS